MSTVSMHFGESTTVEIVREGSAAHLTMRNRDEILNAVLWDGNTGPTVLMDLHAFITRELIDRGYRSEVETNVHAAMARKFRQEATA